MSGVSSTLSYASTKQKQIPFKTKMHVSGLGLND